MRGCYTGVSYVDGAITDPFVLVFTILFSAVGVLTLVVRRLGFG